MRLHRQLVEALRSQMGGGKQRPPEAGALLWNAFNHLSRQRTWHAHGPNPISYAEMEAYCRLMRLPLEPRHVAVLIEMDRAWLDHVMATLKPGKHAPRHVSKAPMTAAMFDALWG